MDVLVAVGIWILEVMFAAGIVFSSIAIIYGIVDFARTVVEG
jgi:hypothetical protein